MFLLAPDPKACILCLRPIYETPRGWRGQAPRQLGQVRKEAATTSFVWVVFSLSLCFQNRQIPDWAASVSLKGAVIMQYFSDTEYLMRFHAKTMHAHCGNVKRCRNVKQCGGVKQFGMPCCHVDFACGSCGSVSGGFMRMIAS